MKKTFIFLACLLSVTLLQADPLSTGCGCRGGGCGVGKKKTQVEHQDLYACPCGCGNHYENDSSDQHNS